MRVVHVYLKNGNEAQVPGDTAQWAQQPALDRTMSGISASPIERFVVFDGGVVVGRFDPHEIAGYSIREH